jgi:hypothetical protein
LRTLIDPEFHVETVCFRGWDDVADGELLRLAAAEYDALVTRGIPHQQNVKGFSLKSSCWAPAIDQRILHRLSQP